ncbi:U11/U12 small nuclear ribonucleoprotein kDa protein [Arachis hypogaea]|nr:U11/U12 small nuclear ribonucleoprotein kDa protein [Arachis hypogaea]
MFRGLPETVGRSRTRSSILVGDDVSGWWVAAGAIAWTAVGYGSCSSIWALYWAFLTVWPISLRRGRIVRPEEVGRLVAKHPGSNSSTQGSVAQLGKDFKASVVKDTTVTKAINGDTKSGCFPVAEPIAERLGVDYPFPPHLEQFKNNILGEAECHCNLQYAYPPPDENILTNIANALIAVPRFYTQVLHLVNKMNIPAPFRMALPTPPLPPPVPTPPPPLPPVPFKPQSADLSSGESKMESSEEEVEPTTKKTKKRARRETIIGPAIDKDVAHEDVGIKPVNLVPKEIPLIKKKNPVLN